MESPEEIQKAFGDNLRTIRLAHGISQEKLGFAAGMDRTYVNSVEQGKRNVSLVNIVRFAEALGLQTRDLFPPRE